MRYLPAKVWRGFVRKLLVALHDLGFFLGTGDNDEIPASNADLDGQINKLIDEETLAMGEFKKLQEENRELKALPFAKRFEQKNHDLHLKKKFSSVCAARGSTVNVQNRSRLLMYS